MNQLSIMAMLYARPSAAPPSGLLNAWWRLRETTHAGGVVISRVSGCRAMLVQNEHIRLTQKSTNSQVDASQTFLSCLAGHPASPRVVHDNHAGAFPYRFRLATGPSLGVWQDTVHLKFR